MKKKSIILLKQTPKQRCLKPKHIDFILDFFLLYLSIFEKFICWAGPWHQLITTARKYNSQIVLTYNI